MGQTNTLTPHLGYERVRVSLTQDEVARISGAISASDRFDFNDYSHVVLSGTNLVVGYVGKETLELCYPPKTDYKILQRPHRHLRKIFSQAGVSSRDLSELTNPEPEASYDH